MRQASGTSMNPAAEPMHMLMTQQSDWMLMFHGAAFVDQVVQSGPRGGDALFSTNWVMGSAQRRAGPGQLMLRTMLSLEPATIGNGRYPELFQTGETVHGRPIVDGQHPHDFFMELAAEYAMTIAPKTIGFVYAAPVGDPSLGPVAYPHRNSASELPQATLSHHVEDSTHIAASVVTIGAQRDAIGLAVSGFQGAEPDEHRWNIDTGAIDSWAARLTFDPDPHWTAQISTGHLKKPEALEPGNVQRTTASVSYSDDRLSTSLIYGHNDKSERSTNAWTAEGVLRLFERHYLTARAEVVDKDELFPGEGEVFSIKALTVGYTRDLLTVRSILAGAGVNLTAYAIPAALKASYGNRPVAIHFFIRLRTAAMSHSMGGMKM